MSNTRGLGNTSGLGNQVSATCGGIFGQFFPYQHLEGSAFGSATGNAWLEKCSADTNPPHLPSKCGILLLTVHAKPSRNSNSSKSYGIEHSLDTSHLFWRSFNVSHMIWLFSLGRSRWGISGVHLAPQLERAKPQMKELKLLECLLKIISNRNQINHEGFFKQAPAGSAS